jgi:hypothetical protein
MNRFVTTSAVALGLWLVPAASHAALSLQIGSQNGPNLNDTTIVPPPGGPRFFDLIFHETGGAQPEGLFTYDIGLRTAGGLNLVTTPVGGNGAGAVEVGPNPVFNTGSPPSIQVSESTPSRLVFNVTSGGDLNDIDEGETAARVFYTLDPQVEYGVYRLSFDPDYTVFGSGDPNLPLSIDVALTDAGVVYWIPEPGTASLLAGAAVVGLLRRRRRV